MGCPICGGSKRIPLPRGMSPGFYAFMGAGVPMRDDGSKLMICLCADKSSDTTETPGNRATPIGADGTSPDGVQ